MMDRRKFQALAAAGLVAPYLRGADFWAEAPYTDWSQKDIQKMLMNSPWAQPYTLQMGGPGGPGGAGGGGGGGRGGGGGGRGGGGGFGGGGGGGGRGGGGRGGGGGGGGGFGGQGLPLVIRWHSAAPIKQANMMAQFGGEGELPKEAMDYLNRPETHYVVSVNGLPGRMGRLAQNTDRLKERASLERKGKEPIAPEQVEVQAPEGAQRISIFFVFPRTDAISMEDKNVEFVMQLGQNKIKQKFALKKMMLDGALAL